MSTNKLYTVAGTSSFNGKTKVRFANDYVTVSYTHLTLPTIRMV